MKKISKVLFTTFACAAFTAVALPSVSVSAEENNYISRFFDTNDVKQFFTAKNFKEMNDLNCCLSLCLEKSNTDPEWVVPDGKIIPDSVSCNGESYGVSLYRQYSYVFEVGYSEGVEIYKSQMVNHIQNFDESSISFETTEIESKEYSYALGFVVNANVKFIIALDVEASVLGTWGYGDDKGRNSGVEISIPMNVETGYYYASLFADVFYYKNVVINEYKVSRSDKGGTKEGYIFEYARKPSDPICGKTLKTAVKLDHFKNLEDIK